MAWAVYAKLSGSWGYTNRYRLESVKKLKSEAQDLAAKLRRSGQHTRVVKSIKNNPLYRYFY